MAAPPPPKPRAKPEERAKSASERVILELGRRLAAGYPILCVVTHEESRAMELVAQAAAGAKVRPFRLTPSVASGQAVAEAIAHASAAVHHD